MEIKTHKESSGQRPWLSLFPKAANDQTIASYRERYREKQTGHDCPGASLEATRKRTAQFFPKFKRTQLSLCLRQHHVMNMYERINTVQVILGLRTWLRSFGSFTSPTILIPWQEQPVSILIPWQEHPVSILIPWQEHPVSILIPWQEHLYPS